MGSFADQLVSVIERPRSSTGPWPSGTPLHELARGERLVTLAAALLALLLASLDQTVVAIASPVLQRELALPVSLYPWITTAYLLAAMVLAPSARTLSDGVGRKPILLAGIALFLCGSLLCGFAGSAACLIVGRAVEGAGAAALSVSAFAVVADIARAAARGRVVALLGAVAGLATAVGPLFGGALTDRFGWRWAFFVNLPIGTVAVAFIVIRMPWLGSPGRARRRIDGVGTLTLAVSLLSLLIALSLGRGARGVPAAGAAPAPGAAWSSAPVLMLFAIAAVGAALFVRRERHARDPIVDVHVFGSPALAWAHAACFAVGGCALAALVFVPLFLANVLGSTATRSGLVLTPLVLGLVAGDALAAWLVARLRGVRSAILATLGLLALAYAVLASTLGPASTEVGTAAKMMLVGAGLGPVMPLQTLALRQAAPADRAASLAASASFFGRLGGLIGVAVLGSVLANHLGGARSVVGGLDLSQAWIAGIRRVCGVAAALAALALVLSSRIPNPSAEQIAVERIATGAIATESTAKEKVG